MPTRPDPSAPRGARGPVNWGRVFPTRPGNIPSKLLGPIVEELLTTQRLTRTQAAQLTGVPERRIWGLINADCLSVGFDRENGRTADFIDCVAFGEEAVLIADRVLKGTHIKLIGSLRSSSWTTKDGAKRYSLDVAADYIQIINRGRALESDAHAPQNTAEPVAA